jgi:hypothetical protein
LHSGVTHWSECDPDKIEVGGSIPLTGTGSVV